MDPRRRRLGLPFWILVAVDPAEVSTEFRGKIMANGAPKFQTSLSRRDTLRSPSADSTPAAFVLGVEPQNKTRNKKNLPHTGRGDERTKSIDLRGFKAHTHTGGGGVENKTGKSEKGSSRLRVKDQ